jgi:hypothetical protein
LTSGVRAKVLRCNAEQHDAVQAEVVEGVGRVRAVDGAARRHVVDAVLEQEVDRERHAGRGRPGGDLLVEPGQAAPGVGAGPDPVHGHRPVTAGLELLLAQRLELDRVLPVQRPRDLHGLAVRIVAGGAVQPERPAGERDVHPDPVLADPGGRRGRHPGVGGPLGADPDLEMPSSPIRHTALFGSIGACAR